MSRFYVPLTRYSSYSKYSESHKHLWKQSSENFLNHVYLKKIDTFLHNHAYFKREKVLLPFSVEKTFRRNCRVFGCSGCQIKKIKKELWVKKSVKCKLNYMIPNSLSRCCFLLKAQLSLRIIRLLMFEFLQTKKVVKIH